MVGVINDVSANDDLYLLVVPRKCFTDVCSYKRCTILLCIHKSSCRKNFDTYSIINDFHR